MAHRFADPDRRHVNRFDAFMTILLTGVCVAALGTHVEQISSFGTSASSLGFSCVAGVANAHTST